MSASNKKKLRKEQEADKLTERQLAAQKDAKKTKLYTLLFTVGMVVILLLAIVVGINQFMTSHGIKERNTVAVTVGDHKLSSTELNYFFIDSVNSFLNNYGSYAAMFGLNTSAPLDQQMYDQEAGTTWADYFISSAKNSAQAVYAVADEAKAQGYTMPEDRQTSLDISMQNLNGYASIYGYADADAYLKAMYGNGASLKTYRNYCEVSALASSYQSDYAQKLSYTDGDLRAADAENPVAYNSYSYNTYYVAASRFLEGGTTAEDGTTTYTDEERSAAAAAAKEAVDALAESESLDALNQAIADMPINAETNASTTTYTDVLYSSVPSTYREWVAASTRQAGEIGVIPSTSTSTAEDGTETTTTNGYYVVFYVGCNDNNFALSNVRHILVAFEGGTQDPNTGVTTYSDAEKAAAKKEADDLLAQFLAADATEESFAALANEKSDDGDGTTGGLYENIGPNSSFVTSFRDWAVADHQVGDVEIIESQYGYHIMYYVGESDTLYRDYMIENDLRNKDANQWYEDLVSAVTVTDGDTSYIRTDLVLKAS